MIDKNFICGKVLWFMGLSGSGKTTIAKELKKRFDQIEIKSLILDGDDLRNGINKDLGFSIEDRYENIRRAAEIAKLLSNNGFLVISCFISPTNEIRNLAKNIIGEERYIEVFLNSELAVCEARDVKGLYKKARAGELKDFSGISSPFEIPEKPDIRVNTGVLNKDESVNLIFEYLLKSSK